MFHEVHVRVEKVSAFKLTRDINTLNGTVLKNLRDCERHTPKCVHLLLRKSITISI